MSAAIIGMAWRTPLGNQIDRALARLLAGERAARKNPRFDASSYLCTVAAALPEKPAPSRHARFVRRMGLYGIEAGLEALQSADVPRGERLGLFVGVGGLRAHWDEMMPALAAQQPDGEAAWARGLSRLHPFWMLRHLSNNAHALLAADIAARGEGATFGGANAGAQAIEEALRALEDRAVDAALVVAYDSLLEPETLVELAARGALAGSDPRAPYDAEANGAVPGEACAALLLQRREDAGARAIALVDARTCADGEKGEPRAETLARLALPIAGGAGVIDGAAHSRPALDAAERDSLRSLGELPLIATAAAMGACGAPTALLQAIALSHLLRLGQLPPIAELRAPVAGPLRPLVQGESTSARVALALSGGAPGLGTALRVELP